MMASKKGVMDQLSCDCWKPALLFITLSPNSIPIQPGPVNQSETGSFVQELAHRKEKKIRRTKRVERELDIARMAIREASKRGGVNGSTWLDGKENKVNVYRNRAAFFKSYAEMEKRFKVYVYEEGEPPLIHRGPCKNIYTTEGRFIEELEQMPPVNGPYERGMRGPDASKGHPALHANSIRALCNANSSEGFLPYKDVSIPEINLVTGDIPSQLLAPLPPLASRIFLAFFVGRVHGPIRPVLLQHWEGKDMGYLPVYNILPEGLDYYSFMLHSRFCLCPSGYEVASPRIVEAIYAECIPVIISQSYVLPFFDVLNWEAFSVSVSVEEIPRLKEILEAIPQEEIERMREGVKEVKKHFVFHQPPQSFDVFYMILHSVWLRRLNVRIL
ncbi:hypothetical protein LUZ60_000876 [Juncus effusus]|nr:hypothetical protein LUZ60_000876 [Juncus effusus]